MKLVTLITAALDLANPHADSLDSGIAQLLVTVQSVVVVYHLASLQSWLQSLQTVYADAETVLSETADGDLRRLRASRRAAQAIRDYPWIQVLFLLIAIVTLGVLTFMAGQQMTAVAWYYVELPGGLLVAIYVFSSISIFTFGYRRMAAMLERLK